MRDVILQQKSFTASREYTGTFGLVEQAWMEKASQV